MRATPNPQPVVVGGGAIGPGQPCFVVAEAGVNHNGDVELAKRLIEAAREAGADAVKFQTWSTDELVAPNAPLATYQAEHGGASDQHELLSALEFGRREFAELKSYAEAAGILFFSAADDEPSADLLDELGVELFKIGSGEVTNTRLLSHIAAKGKPIVLSTGMADLAEVEAAVDAIERGGCRSLVLLHCVSLYPAPPEEANLRAMETLAQAFGYPVGFSDHTLGTEIALAAVACGAVLIEKHLTLDTSLPGPDHALSLDPPRFRRLVEHIRLVEQALGDGRKRPAAAELEMRRVVRRIVVSAVPLSAGQELRTEDLALRRAGDGLPAAALDAVVGRRLRMDLPAGAAVTLDILE